MEDDPTLYCSFVGVQYIICECGENFDSEEALKEHLEKENHHKNEPKPVQIEKTSVKVRTPVKVQTQLQPKIVVYSGNKRSNPNTEHRKPIILKQSDLKKYVILVPKKQELKLEKDEEYGEDEEDEEDNGDNVKNEQQEENESGEEYKTEEQDEDSCDDASNDGLPEGSEKVIVMPSQEYEFELKQEPDDMEAMLEVHLATEHSYQTTEEYSYCDQCGKGFTSVELLEEHKKKHHAMNIEELTKYKCECGKSYATQRGISLHMLKKHTNVDDAKPIPIKRIVCEVCGKKYASNAALRYHQRVHTGERPYQCPMCPKKFTMPLFLQIHIRTHTGERPYACPHCPKAFGSKAALLRHDRVHTGIKPYACPKCNKTFTQSNSRKLHFRTVHLKLPTPYKSAARRAKAKARQEVQLYEVDSSQYTEQLVYPSDEEVKIYEEVYEENSIGE